MARPVVLPKVSKTHVPLPKPAEVFVTNLPTYPYNYPTIPASGSYFPQSDSLLLSLPVDTYSVVLSWLNPRISSLLALRATCKSSVVTMEKFLQFIDPVNVLKDLTSCLWSQEFSHSKNLLYLSPEYSFEFYFKEDNFSKGMGVISGTFGIERDPTSRASGDHQSYPVIHPSDMPPPPPSLPMTAITGISLKFKVDDENCFRISMRKNPTPPSTSKLEFVKYQELKRFNMEQTVVVKNSAEHIIRSMNNVSKADPNNPVPLLSFPFSPFPSPILSPPTMPVPLSEIDNPVATTWYIHSSKSLERKEKHVVDIAMFELVPPIAPLVYCGAPDVELVENGDACCHKAVLDILNEVWDQAMPNFQQKFSERFSCEVKSELADEVAIECMKSAMTDQEIRISLVTKLIARDQCQN